MDFTKTWVKSSKGRTSRLQEQDMGQRRESCELSLAMILGVLPTTQAIIMDIAKRARGQDRCLKGIIGGREAFLRAAEVFTTGSPNPKSFVNLGIGPRFLLANVLAPALAKDGADAPWAPEANEIVNTRHSICWEFVECNLPLVGYVIKKYFAQTPFFNPSSIPDLMSEGSIGLYHAATRYDKERGLRFGTMAVPWIHQSMRRWQMVHDHGNILPPVSLVIKPINMKERVYRLNGPSLSTPVKSRGGRRSLELMDVLPGVNDPAIEAAPDRVDLARHACTLFCTLSPLEERVISCRFGFGDEHEQTLREIGHRLQRSAERIRQIEAEAMAKIRVIASAAPEVWNGKEQK